jgi:energy-coupling factor transporter transmembrane protein EcfT
MLFCQQSLLQLRSHSYFLSHTLMGSIYLCHMDLSLVAFDNGIMTNDWWCHDETESLLWCTHGWAARHALVSWLIVVIHIRTILMCSLLWTFSQSDRCILSQYAVIFYPNLSSVSCQIPSHEFASISSLGVTCFSTLKGPYSNLRTRFF